MRERTQEPILPPTRADYIGNGLIAAFVLYTLIVLAMY